MTGLSKKVSQAVVNEIAAVLGESTAVQALGATGARFKVLAAGRGQLSESELKQIFKVTEKTWRTWLLGTIKSTGDSHQILAPTLELVNSLNDAEADGENTPKSSKRPSATRVV
jgi:formylmethanofuran dehydrogenase subunit E-like metal-binding protein